MTSLEKSVLRASLASLAVAGLAAVVQQEGLNTPADEMKLLAPYCEAVMTVQLAHLRETGRYGTLKGLSVFANRKKGTALGEVPRGYNAELEVGADAFELSLTPSPDPQAPPKRLAVYCNQAGLVTFSYGQRRAGRTSEPVPAKWRRPPSYEAPWQRVPWASPLKRLSI